jgi:hypothetical protein
VQDDRVHGDRVRGTPRRPGGLLAIPALVAPVAICGIPGHTSSGTRLAAEVGLLALVVGVVGFESTVSVGLVAAGTSVLSLNGFAEDAYGQLGWHPGVDLRAAAVLCAALVLACAARRGVDRARPEPPAESHIHAMTGRTRPAHDHPAPD